MSHCSVLNYVHTSHKSQCVSATKISGLMLCREVVSLQKSTIHSLGRTQIRNGYIHSILKR